MPLASSFAFRCGLVLLGGGVTGWMLWRFLKRSDDPSRLLFRWLITLLVVVGGYFGIDWLIGPAAGLIENMAGVFLGMFLGLILAGLWVPPLVETVSEIIGGLFTGGREPPETQPFYSVAEAKLKQNKFKEALDEIQRQLESFPTDVTGHVMFAQIQAEHLDDVGGAQLTIERFCAQRGHGPQHLAYALNALADWHLKLQDTDAARTAFEKIIALAPDTEQARMAAQRIAHLASRQTLLAAQEHKPIPLPHGAQNIGLMTDSTALLRPEEDLEQVTQWLVNHLEEHPLDNEAREKLALIYAGHYQRLDLAIDQLEQLIALPHQPRKEVARWLNVIADLQIRHGADYDEVRRTLQRVLDRFPDLAAGRLAQQRIEHLRLEFKGKEKSQVVKLGSYEKDIGLKRRPPA